MSSDYKVYANAMGKRNAYNIYVGKEAISEILYFKMHNSVSEACSENVNWLTIWS